MNENATNEQFDNVEAETAIVAAANSYLGTLAESTSESISLFGFDPNSPEGMVRVFNAEEDGESLNDSGVTELTLDGIHIVPGTRVDPVSGSRTPCANTILMSVDGHNYVSQSNGIARTAARIANLYANVGWPEGGVKVEVTEQKLAGGRTYKKLALRV